MSKVDKSENKPMISVIDFVLFAQKTVTKVKRETENEHFKSKYADLEDVLDLLNPLFQQHDVVLVQSLEKDTTGAWVLRTEMTKGPNVRAWFFPIMLPDSKNPMQALGSAFTYARRYSLKGIFKLVDSDDDAESVAPADLSAKPARKSDVDKMLRAFASINVSKEEIEARAKLDTDQFTSEEMADLMKVFKKIKDDKEDKKKFFSGDKSWQE